MADTPPSYLLRMNHCNTLFPLMILRKCPCLPLLLPSHMLLFIHLMQSFIWARYQWNMPATSTAHRLLLIASPPFQSLHFPCISDRMDGVKLPHTVHSCSIYGMSYRFPSTLRCGRNVRKLLITYLSQELDFCLPLAALQQSLCWSAGLYGKWNLKVIILWSLQKKIKRYTPM